MMNRSEVFFPPALTMSAGGKVPHFSFIFFKGPLSDWLGQILLNFHWLTQTDGSTNALNSHWRSSTNCVRLWVSICAVGICTWGKCSCVKEDKTWYEYSRGGKNLDDTAKMPYLCCYWPDFDETLKAGSWELLEQIPTVTETFVHIRNISAVSDPILTKL